MMTWTEETEENHSESGAQNSVDRDRWMVERAEERTKRTLGTTIPREYTRLKHSLELGEINWRNAEKKLPPNPFDKTP